MTRTNQSPNLDERLAAYTDQVLDGQADDASVVGFDPELRTLAETVLRLKNAFPREELSQTAVKRLYDRILIRQRDDRKKPTPWLDFFRLEWLTPPRRRLATAVVWVTVAAILVVSLPTLLPGGLVGGWAGEHPLMSPPFWIFLGVLVILFFWFLRRK